MVSVWPMTSFRGLPVRLLKKGSTRWQLRQYLSLFLNIFKNRPIGTKLLQLHCKYTLLFIYEWELFLALLKKQTFFFALPPAPIGRTPPPLFFSVYTQSIDHHAEKDALICPRCKSSTRSYTSQDCFLLVRRFGIDVIRVYSFHWGLYLSQALIACCCSKRKDLWALVSTWNELNTRAP